MASRKKIIATATRIGVKQLANPGKVALLVSCVGGALAFNPFISVTDAVKTCARRLGML